MENGNPYIYHFHVGGRAVIRNDTRGKFTVFGHLSSSLEAEKSVPAPDCGSPLDTPGNDIPSFPVFFQGLQEFQIFSLRPSITAYRAHA